MTEAIALVLALHLIVLHRSDGGDVTISADQVTSLRSPVGELHKLAPSARCLVGLTDGKFVGVREDCAQVKTLLEK